MTGLRVLLLGGSGTIGRATARALVGAGCQVTALLRPGSVADLPGCTVLRGAVDVAGVTATMAGVRPDAVISCLASRTGAPRDAWSVEHDANAAALQAALAEGVARFILVSAICVQKPRLEFQKAKLAFERALQAAPIGWTILRPTAFFKSLSGQVVRVRAGRAFLVFGDGRGTACKPISNDDLGRFVVHCLNDPATVGRILPIGGPGPAITPMDQVAILERLSGAPVKVKHVPLALMDGIVVGLSLLGRFSRRMADRAEFVRIGRYYATESMLVWDGARYDADQTPEWGQDRLEDHYAALWRGDLTDDRGAHAVF